jgi:hypothetical protein
LLKISSNPHPEPTPALKQAVQPLATVQVSPTDAAKLAEMYTKIANQIDIGSFTDLEHLNSSQAVMGRTLDIQRSDALGDAIEKAYEAAIAPLNAPNRSLAMNDVKAFRAMAWAIWRAN